MKKLTTLLMMLCLGLFIVGCGGGDDAATDGGDTGADAVAPTDGGAPTDDAMPADDAAGGDEAAPAGDEAAPAGDEAAPAGE